MNIANLFKGIATLSWIVFVLLVVWTIYRSSRNHPVRNARSILISSVLAAVALTAVGGGLVFIDPQNRGVVLSAVSPKGYREQPLGPGLHWVIPFAENVIQYPISKQTYTMSVATSEGANQGDDSISARTLDGQEIFVDASVIYEINPAKVVDVHIQWQDRYGDDLVRAQSRGIVRDVISQYRVDEVVSTKRTEMTKTISDKMASKLADNGLFLVDFVLRNITFSKEYASSVEQKQIAEQQAQQAKFVVESKKQEAEQARQIAQGAADAAVIRAKGDAQARIVQADAEKQALELINQAIKDNPALLNYLYINKLSPSIQTMLIPSNSPYILSLPTQSPSSPTTSGSILPSDAPTAAPTVAPTTVPTAKP